MSRIISFLIIGSILLGIDAYRENSKREIVALSATENWLTLNKILNLMVKLCSKY